MTRRVLCSAACLAAALAARALPPQEAGAGLKAEALERGRYLVHHVAMCIECHTPRRGPERLDAELLQGAPLPVGPPPGFDEWCIHVPRIAGLPGYTPEQGITLLTQGLTRTGRRPRPPMPPFRMTEADAAAVVAYLQSLR